MQVFLDKDFQIRLPEELVRRMKLEPNSTLELSVQDDKLVLEPEAKEAKLVRVDGLWVAQASLPDGQSADLIEQMRLQRLGEVSGF